MTMTKETLRQHLVEMTGGCDIQHTGWPCNTCFHALRERLGITVDEIHNMWEAVLVFRGDYKLFNMTGRQCKARITQLTSLLTNTQPR